MPYANFELLGKTPTGEPVAICTEPGCGCLMQAQKQPMFRRILWQVDCLRVGCNNELHTAYVPDDALAELPIITNLSALDLPTK